jgi:hypothetical protein
MAYQRVDVGGRTETWLLCANCRTAAAPEPAPAPPAVTTAVPASAAVTQGHASDGPLAAQLDSAGINGPDPVPAPAGRAAAAPAPRVCVSCGNPEHGPRHGGGNWGPLVAYAEPLFPGDPDTPRLVHRAHFEDESTGFHGRPYQPAPAPAGAHVPGGEIAAGASPTQTQTSTDGGHVSTELELADGGGRLPARAGESYNYGAWAQATASDAELLEQLGLCVEAMLSDLTAVSAGRTQVQNVTAWADRVRAEADLTRDAIHEMDRRYRPVIATVAAVGGPDEVSNSSYYQEI